MESIKISRFMIVDHDKETALAFKVTLGKLQYQNITMCHTPEDALELIETKRIQFIILCWELEGMTGSAFVQRIKANEKFKYIPFVIYSSELSDEDIEVFQHFSLDTVIKYPDESENCLKTIKETVASEEDLDPVEQRIRQADSLRLEKQHTQALSVIKPALVMGPFFAHARTLLAQIQLEQGDYAAAEEALKEVIEGSDEHPPAIQVMARIYSQTKRHDQAVQTLQKLTTQHPYNIDAIIELGMTYVSAEDYQKAQDTFAKAKELDPDNKKLAEEEGKMYFKQGKFELAAQLLQEMEDSEKIARDFNNIAVGLVSKADFKKAIPTYQAAINILRNHDEYTHLLEYNLGLALRKSGNHQDAFTFLAGCFKRNPNFTKAYAALVRLVKEMEDQDIVYDRKLMHELKNLHKKQSAA